MTKLTCSLYANLYQIILSLYKIVINQILKRNRKPCWFGPLDIWKPQRLRMQSISHFPSLNSESPGIKVTTVILRTFSLSPFLLNFLLRLKSLQSFFPRTFILFPFLSHFFLSLKSFWNFILSENSAFPTASSPNQSKITGFYYIAKAYNYSLLSVPDDFSSPHQCS